MSNLYDCLIFFSFSCSAEQEGIKADPIEISQFVSFVKRNKLQTESFCIGPNECELDHCND